MKEGWGVYHYASG
jgi:hypothetical protein